MRHIIFAYKHVCISCTPFLVSTYVIFWCFSLSYAKIRVFLNICSTILNCILAFNAYYRYRCYPFCCQSPHYVIFILYSYLKWNWWSDLSSYIGSLSSFVFGWLISNMPSCPIFHCKKSYILKPEHTIINSQQVTLLLWMRRLFLRSKCTFRYRFGIISLQCYWYLHIIHYANLGTSDAKRRIYVDQFSYFIHQSCTNHQNISLLAVCEKKLDQKRAVEHALMTVHYTQKSTAVRRIRL